MVDHPASYHRPNYRANALGKRIRSLKPHERYLSLGESTEERTTTYLALIKHHIPDFTVKQIRDAVNDQVDLTPLI